MAMSVMLGIVAENLPKSDEMTVLGDYLIGTLSLGAISILTSLAMDFVLFKV